MTIFFHQMATLLCLCCRLAFNLKLKRMECIEESIEGCGHFLRNKVWVRYKAVLADFQSKCARDVPDPETKSG